MTASDSSSTNPIRVVFLGTPHFACPTLQALLDAPDIDIVGVMTQPDKPSGRGKQLSPPPIKVLAEAHQLHVCQPKRLRKDEEAQAWLKEKNPDFLVTAAFGQILPQVVLDTPRLGTVNVHASLLPHYRGPNPIQRAMLNGDSETGVTTMLTDIGVDTGDMLLKATVPITDDDTMGELTKTLSQTGAHLLVDTLRQVASGELKPTPQDHDAATHAPKCNKEDGAIDWSEPAALIARKVRAFDPWPGTFTMYAGQRVKIIAAHKKTSASDEIPESGTAGEWLAVNGDGLYIGTRDGVLCVSRLQPAGKKAMASKDWLNGLGVKSSSLPEASCMFEAIAVEASDSARVTS